MNFIEVATAILVILLTLYFFSKKKVKTQQQDDQIILLLGFDLLLLRKEEEGQNPTTGWPDNPLGTSERRQDTTVLQTVDEQTRRHNDNLRTKPRVVRVVE